jgi:hypothetical protein
MDHVKIVMRPEQIKRLSPDGKKNTKKKNA